MFKSFKKSSDKRIGIKIIATLLILTLTSLNFIMLGSYIAKSYTSYATSYDLEKQNDKANVDNVIFDVYFKENNEHKKTINKDINFDNLYLYVCVGLEDGRIV